MDDSAKQLELPHLHFDGEDQWEMWTDPESGETITTKAWVCWGFFVFIIFVFGQSLFTGSNVPLYS